MGIVSNSDNGMARFALCVGRGATENAKVENTEASKC